MTARIGSNNVVSGAVAPGSLEGARGLVLLVDDDPTIVRGYARTLTASGYRVEIAHDGRQAAALARTQAFDVIVSDISMPEMTGLQLLRSIREHDLDVPVVLMTGGPAVESAIQAMEYGALRYLIKPVPVDLIEEVVARAVRLHQMAKLKREALELFRVEGKSLGDRASLEARFKSALGSLWVAYQPIVSCGRRDVFAYEALVRNEEPTLRSPLDLFDAAERLGRLNELGRIIRERVATAAADLPGDALLFVNVNPSDLSDELLFSHASPLTPLASRVVLEVTERAPLDQLRDLLTRVAKLRKLGYRIAVDDLGAGYAGLTSFAQLEPEVVKIDMSLVRGVDASPTKQKLIKSMIQLCRDLDIQIIAEGVETAGERDALIEIGADLCQGYFFARPGPAFPPASF